MAGTYSPLQRAFTVQPRMVPLVQDFPWRSSTPEQPLRIAENLTHKWVRATTQAAAQARGQAREDLYDEARRQQRDLRRLRVLIAASQGTPGLQALDAVLGKPQTVRGKE